MDLEDEDGGDVAGGAGQQGVGGVQVDDDDDGIVTKPVPQAVLKQAGGKTKAAEEAVGAMERIKRKRMAEG